MICIKCKKEIPDGSAFCNHCGKEQNPKPKKRSRKRPHGSGTIRKDERNKSKPWIAMSPSSRYGTSRVYLGSFKTYKEAQEAIEKYASNGYANLNEMPLQRVYEMWSEAHFKTISKSSVEMYTHMWKRFKPLYQIKASEIRTAHIQEVINEAPSSSTAGTLKVLIAMVLKYALQNDIVAKNYAEFVIIPKSDKKGKGAFTQDQLKTLWNHSDDNAVRMILFMTYTGLRIGEFANLKVNDCHIDSGYFVCGEKTEAGINRVVPLPENIQELAAWLFDWKQKAEKSGLDTVIGMSADYIRTKMFYPALDRIGIDYKAQNITPHSCRHTFASMCAGAGMQPEQLQKIIGHANYSTTADVYIHNDLDTLKRAMAILKRFDSE